MISNFDVENIEHLIYIKKDFDSAQKLLDKLFEIFILKLPSNKKIGNKHKCSRNEFCECIELGLLILEINTRTQNNLNVVTLLEKYYYNPGINLPFELFKFACKCMVKLLDFQNVRSLIENYITYSKIKSTNDLRSFTFEISHKQYEQLNEILIFEVILIQGGFNRAKAKIISGINDEMIKQKFLDKFYSLLLLYTNEKEKDLMNSQIVDSEKINDVNFSTKISKYNPNLFNKISSIIDKTTNTNFTFSQNFSNFTIKNSILQKLISIIQNKKFLIFALTIVILIIFRKVLKLTKIDNKIIIFINKLAVYLKNFSFFSAIQSFGSGLFKLLVNY